MKTWKAISITIGSSVVAVAVLFMMGCTADRDVNPRNDASSPAFTSEAPESDATPFDAADLQTFRDCGAPPMSATDVACVWRTDSGQGFLLPDDQPDNEYPVRVCETDFDASCVMWRADLNRWSWSE